MLKGIKSQKMHQMMRNDLCYDEPVLVQYSNKMNYSIILIHLSIKNLSKAYICYWYLKPGKEDMVIQETPFMFYLPRFYKILITITISTLVI